MKFNWKDLPPYDHKGRWRQDVESIMNPMSFVSFPQFVCEMIIYNRSKLIKSFPRIQMGPGWSRAIPGQVRSLTQQCYNLCNYFPHPDDDPLVVQAFKNFFRQTRCVSVGTYRKNRITKDGKVNIAQAEKDCIVGISSEYERLKNKVDSCTQHTEKPETKPEKNDIVYNPTNDKNSMLTRLLEIEKKLKDGK